MSFTGTEGSIKNLSSNPKISMEDLFEMLLVVTADVMDHNKAEDIDGVEVIDSHRFVLNSLALGEMFAEALNYNKNLIANESNTAQEKYREYLNKFNELVQESKAVSNEIIKAQSKQKELAQKKEELEEERGPLVKISEECNRIQNRIDFLSDSALDNVEKTRDQLQYELQKRQLKFEALEKAEKQTKDQLNTIQSDFDKVNKDILTLNQNISRLTEEKRTKEEEKNGLELGLQNLKDKIAKLDEWLKEYPEHSKMISVECQAKCDEQKAKKAEIAALFNAFTSSFNDEFLKTSLYKNPESLAELSIDNYPDLKLGDLNLKKVKIGSFEELKSCINSIASRVDGLITVLEQALTKVVEESQKLTADNKE